MIFVKSSLSISIKGIGYYNFDPKNVNQLKIKKIQNMILCMFYDYGTR